MELAFQTSKLPFLRCVLQEVRTQEETAETIVPDTYPDIASIVDAYAVPIIHGKDCRDGSVTISGGIKGGILYQPEDGSAPRSLDFYLPFLVKLEHPALTERAQVNCTVSVCSADGRIVNSRKAMLRVSLGCQVCAYEQAEETLYGLQDKPDALQLRTAVYPLQLPLETSEKSFVLSETLEVPTGQPPVFQIYKTWCHPELTDQKLVGSKAVFKGAVQCKILYASEDQTLHVLQQQLPFSQYCELQTDYDEEQVTVLPVITGFDTEPESGETARRLLMTVHLLAQCTVSGRRNITLIEDAYSTKGTLIPQWKQYAFNSWLDRKVNMHTVRQHIPGDIRELLDSDVYLSPPSMEQIDGQVRIRTLAQVHVLGRNADGQLCACCGTGEAVQELASGPQVRFWPNSSSGSSCFAAVLPDGVEARCEVSTEILCCGGQPLTCLVAASLEETDDRQERPSVILRRAARNTPLWDLARECAAREEAIRAANHLEGDRVPEDSLLLIPIG